MLLRFPWLLSRKRLLAAICIDTALFCLLYLLWFQLRFDGWPGFSLPLTWLLESWLVSSYVFGRYHGDGGSFRSILSGQALRTLAVLLISISLYLGYHWLAAKALGQADTRSFLLPFLLGLALFSGATQFFLAWLVQLRLPSSQQWLMVGSMGVFQLLERQLSWSRLSASVVPWTAGQNTFVDHFFDPVSEAPAIAGVLVSDFGRLGQDQEKQLLSLQNQGLPVLSVLGWCERVLQRFPPELLSGADLLRGDFSIPQGSIQLRLKRLGDVTVSAILLLLALPLLLLAALLIWVDDRGPVLYSQVRSGRGGEPFRVWKLRTMQVDAERSGAQWAGRGDPRITRMGRVLRVTRIDELPQLWAVLRGTMSLIGPRPERPEFEQELDQQIPHYRLRHWMRPGLSGWAQVNYPYGASVEDAANKLSYDLYYLRNFSFWLDLLILFKTMRLVFNAQGAVAQR